MASHLIEECCDSITHIGGISRVGSRIPRRKHGRLIEWNRRKATNIFVEVMDRRCLGINPRQHLVINYTNADPKTN